MVAAEVALLEQPLVGGLKRFHRRREGQLGVAVTAQDGHRFASPLRPPDRLLDVGQSLGDLGHGCLVGHLRRRALQVGAVVDDRTDRGIPGARAGLW